MMKHATKLLWVLPAFMSGYAYAAPQRPDVLIAYYSLTGKTEKVAKAIADVSGGRLYSIQVEKIYPENAKERRAILNKEIEENYLPPLKSIDINLKDYDIIFLGSPVWANHLSLPVKSFLSKYDLSGKKVIPFVTHSGGGRGSSFDDVAALCNGCLVDMDGWSSWGSGTGRSLNKWVQQQIADIK